MAEKRQSVDHNDKTPFNFFESEEPWEAYQDLRPTYPLELYDTIRDYMQKNNHTDRQLAIDYGSGTGTVVPRLLEHLAIRKVIGTDVAGQNLEKGKQRLLLQYGSDRYETMVGAAGELNSIPDESVDLVTAAEAVHWFDQDKWLREVARILKPTGTVAMWLYPPHPVVLSDEKVTTIAHEVSKRISDIAVPKGLISIKQVLNSATLLDNVVVDPSRFSVQERYKWLLPKDIADRLDRCTDFSLNDDPYTEEEATAGLLAAPDTKMYEFRPDGIDKIAMQASGWTVKKFVQYLPTVAMPIEKAVSDEIFMRYIREIEDLLGDPSATFNVGWSLGLVLATRR